MFWTIFGRTELILGASKANNGEEYATDVRFYVAPQKPDQNAENRISETPPKPFLFSASKHKMTGIVWNAVYAKSGGCTGLV